VVCSDVGLTRAHNEDYFEVDPRHQLFVVADGMAGTSRRGGGAAGGRGHPRLHREDGRPDTTWPAVTDSRLRRHSNLLKMPCAWRTTGDGAIREDGALSGMGRRRRLLLEGATAAVAHVGDQPGLPPARQPARQLTQDHTWVHDR